MEQCELPLDSPFLSSRIVGTTSAKLSYLSSEILKHHQQEKILVFYDGDNAAYYIAQMLDLLHIKHEIYAKSLKASLKSEYAVRFDQETQDRVLLMDVRQAAFGLNLPAASRIYFVNPVCRENIEAQAIKRAHRIGQKRAVHVETLVLKGTIEEKMLDRSKRMTRAEHLNASHLEDDGGIKQIIQSAAPLPIHETSLGRPQMAPLDVPQQVWCRKGWRQYQIATAAKSSGKKRKTASDVDDEAGATGSQRKTKMSQKVVRRTLAFVDCRSGEQSGDAGPSHASTDAASSSTSIGVRPTQMTESSQSSANNGVSPTTNSAHGAHVLVAPPFSPLLAPISDQIDQKDLPRLTSVPNPTINRTTLQTSGTRRSSAGKMSVSMLLNDDPRPPAGNTDLMQSILQRL